MTPKTTIIVRREAYLREQFGFLLVHHLSGGRVATVEPLTMKVHDPNVVLPDSPTFALDREEATRLMDELWNAGVRPSEHGSAGQLAATEAHLHDMRALVFREAIKPKP